LSSEERRPARDSHFVLTITELHRLYILSRAELLTELRFSGVPTITAHEALQAAFAAVAKIRFSFRSENEVVEWIRSETRGEITSPATSSVLDAVTPPDWDDVLRRANIATVQAPVPIATAPGPRSRAWLAGLWSSRRSTSAFAAGELGDD
jgi:hypothetical protein